MRDKIKLVSSAGTGYFYTTTKNKRLATGKLKLKKYDPKVRKHVEFERAEGKGRAARWKGKWPPRGTGTTVLTLPPPSSEGRAGGNRQGR